MIFQSLAVSCNLIACLFILETHVEKDSGGDLKKKNGLATHQNFPDLLKDKNFELGFTCCEYWHSFYMTFLVAFFKTCISGD